MLISTTKETQTALAMRLFSTQDPHRAVYSVATPMNPGANSRWPIPNHRTKSMIQYRYQIHGVHYPVGANAAFLVSLIHAENDIRPITTAALVAGLRADFLQLNGLKQTNARYQLDTLIFVVASVRPRTGWREGPINEHLLQIPLPNIDGITSIAATPENWPEESWLGISHLHPSGSKLSLHRPRPGYETVFYKFFPIHAYIRHLCRKPTYRRIPDPQSLGFLKRPRRTIIIPQPLTRHRPSIQQLPHSGIARAPRPRMLLQRLLRRLCAVQRPPKA